MTMHENDAGNDDLTLLDVAVGTLLLGVMLLGWLWALCLIVRGVFL